MPSYTLTEFGDLFDGTAAADIIKGMEGNDEIRGLGGDDKIYGGPGADELYGGEGNDYLEANTGVPFSGALDKLYGEAGDDIIRPGGNVYSLFYGGDGNDDIVGTAFGVVEGGAGADKMVGTGGRIGTVLSYASSNAGVTIDLAKNTAKGGHASGDTIRKFANARGSEFNDLLRGTNNANSLHGEGGNDTLHGLAGDDGLVGGDGRDSLFGGDGDDLLVGGAGADLLDGSKGIDTVSYSDARSGVTANLAKPGQNRGEAKGDTYKSIENLQGSAHNDRLTGDKNDNQINDIGGADIIRGGAGDDMISSSDSYLKPAKDKLYGDGGDDTIFVGAGGDFVDGGKGFDTLVFSFTSEPIQKIFLDGRPGKGGNAEGAVIINMESITAPSGDVDIIGGKIGEEIDGGTGKNTLLGNGGNDILDGRAGDDVLNGGNGNDTLIGDVGADRLIGGKGIDTVDYTFTFDDLVINLAKGTGKGDDAEGDRLSGIENVIGGYGADQLIGSKANNVLDGGSDNDILKGGDGNDTLIGGFGKDTLTGGAGADRFAFDLTSQSHGDAATRDVITDFNRKQKDKIDVSGIDAKESSKKKTNDAFVFIGDRAFSGKEGELRAETVGKKTFVYGNVDGDKDADFAIELAGKIALVKGDFVL
jgi:Ca2+-binding RTX toxin-like protein